MFILLATLIVCFLLSVGFYLKNDNNIIFGIMMGYLGAVTVTLFIILFYQ